MGRACSIYVRIINTYMNVVGKPGREHPHRRLYIE
jgi:hypothetical protein